MKRNKKLVKIMAVVLAALMLGSLFVSVLVTLARAAGGDDIDELQEQKTQLQEKQKRLEAEKAALAEKKAELSKSIGSLENERYTALQKKKLLDENLELTNREIENAAAEIALLDEKIEIKKREYEDALAEEERQMKIFKRRLRAMEENGTITYYEILFDASSFSDFLSRLDSISEIIKADELIIRKIERARLQLVLAQQEYWDSKDEQEAAKAALEAKKAELQKELDAADEYIRGIEADIAAYEADAEANRDKLAQIQAELEAQIAAQAALDEMIERLLREQRDINAGVYAKGSFLWPSADSKLVTSIYGMRLHPILGYTTMHNGIDIGAAYGTDIYASDGGIVIISEYSSSYGNYVMLNHGGGRYTLYAHMSKRLVEVDDAVSQGDVIGLVGSTGYSTGPHIHFEVYIDEKRVDPLQFFSNYTILD